MCKYVQPVASLLEDTNGHRVCATSPAFVLVVGFSTAAGES